MTRPDTREELLKSLNIDRSADNKLDGNLDGSRRSVLVVVLALILGAAIGTIWVWKDPGAQASVETLAVVTKAPLAVPESALVSPVDESGVVLNASGYVIARRAATVSSKTTGKVEEVLIEEGMEVVAGQVLARLDSRIEMAQLALAEAEVEAAVALSAELDAEIERVQMDLQRWRALEARSLSSRAALDALNAELGTLLSRQLRSEKEVIVARRRVDMQQVRVNDQTIRAPFTGTVVKKSAQPGEMISPVSAGGGFTRTGICTIVDMASLEVEVDVNESYINRVSPGQPVSIRLAAYPDRDYPGEVLAVIPTADRSKATIRVRLKFLEADDRVLPNMGLQVAFLERAEGSR